LTGAFLTAFLVVAFAALLPLLVPEVIALREAAALPEVTSFMLDSATPPPFPSLEPVDQMNENREVYYL